MFTVKLLSRSGINDVALSLKKIVALTQRCLVLSLVEISQLVLENMMFLKDAIEMYFNYFVIISPCKSLKKLEHLSWNWLSYSGKEYYVLSLFCNLLISLFSKWCGLSLPKTLSFFHAEFSFVYLDNFCKLYGGHYFRVYAKFHLNVLYTRVFKSPLPMTPLKKYDRCSIP